MTTLIFIILIFAIGFLAGHIVGYSKGFDDAIEKLRGVFKK